MLYSYDLYPHGLIGPVEILWQPDEEMNGDRTLWIRIHPSIFQECWDALKSVLKRCSTVPPDDAGPSNQLALESAIHMRDLRGEVDAFEIMGPLAGRVLRRVLRVCKDEEHCKHQVCLHCIIGHYAKFTVFRKSRDRPGTGRGGLDCRPEGLRSTPAVCSFYAYQTNMTMISVSHPVFCQNL